MTKPRLHTFRTTSHYPSCTPEQLYKWHKRDGALERLLPPWQKIKILKKSRGITPGSTVKLQIYSGPLGLIRIPFTARHTQAEPYRFFQDTQEKGPFSYWTHTHLFHKKNDGCALEDKVDYSLPFHKILPNFIQRYVKQNLQKMFHYRVKTLQEDMLLHTRCSKNPMRILISGASGVLGKDLVPLLSTGGHEVWRLVRTRADITQREIQWDPQADTLDIPSTLHFDAVIHLAGEYIGLHRWTAARKERVLQSRINGTTLLVNKLATMQKKPSVFLCASATGYYGNSSDIKITEEHSPGESFISEVCKQWEAAAVRAEESGIRTVLLRFGVGLTPRGGALQRILEVSLFGYLRYFGSGDQMISWISSDDMIAATLHCLSHNIRGAVNIVSPEPVTNREFMQQLSAITKKPLLLPFPAWLIRLIYGDMAKEMLLASTHISCKKLIDSGFHFRHPNLTTALKALLGKQTRNKEI